MKQKRRTLRNLLMIAMIAVLAVGMWLTVDAANSSTSGNMPQMQSEGSAQQPPEMPDGATQNSDSTQPPQKPEGDAQNGSTGAQPPEMPQDNSQNNSSDNSFPTPPSGDSNTPTQMPGGKQGKSVSALYYAALVAESLAMAALALYLIMSQMNKKSVRETLNTGKRITIFVLAAAIITAGLTCAGVSAVTATQGMPASMSQPGEMSGTSSASADTSGATTVDGKEETLDGTYTSDTADESAVLVTNGGNATVTGTISKTGDSSNTESSEFYGVNAAVLVQKDSTATIEDATITTDAKGANAVFATGENAKIYVKNTTITSTGSSSARGLDATYGGYIEADSITVTTQGGSCAALATDRGEGTVIASNSTLTTNGAGSPVIYSTGDIRIDKTKGTANGAQNVVIEGKNSATVTNSTLTASGTGNRGNTDQAGVMIYQSMSGDAGEGTGTFTAENSSLSIQKSSDCYKTAPMFFVTNTDAVINLKNTALSFGSGTLLSAKGTDEWGTSGSNGGNVTLNAESQTLTGNITADSISTVALNLTKSAYTGTINGDNTAKEVTLTLDADSTLKLTGDCYVTSLKNADTTNSNIDFNGYTLYVNGTAVN